MDPIANERATAQELISFAQQQGVDLESLRHDTLFQREQRWIVLWRKQNELPCTGPADEKEGTLHYNIQGAVRNLPSQLTASTAAFRGMWHEAGRFDNLAQAFSLLKAWLLDRKEVDELPERHVERYGI
jgi:hypothetical protein